MWSMKSWRGCKLLWSNRVEVVILDDKTMQSAVARLVAAATSPSQVILFASYARGMANEGSEQREIPNITQHATRLHA